MSFVVPTDVKQALQRMADKEHRALSAFLRLRLGEMVAAKATGATKARAAA